MGKGSTSMVTKRKKIPLVGENLETLLRHRQWGNQIHLFSLARQWPGIIGQHMAARTMPAFFRRDVLWIYVQGATWMQELQYAKPALLEKINTCLNRQHVVHDLRFQEYPSELLTVAHEAEGLFEAGVDPVAEQEFKVMASSIADPVTREALCRMWLCLSVKNESGGRTTK